MPDRSMEVGGDADDLPFLVAAAAATASVLPDEDEDRGRLRASVLLLVLVSSSSSLRWTPANEDEAPADAPADLAGANMC